MARLRAVPFQGLLGFALGLALLLAQSRLGFNDGTNFHGWQRRGVISMVEPFYDLKYTWLAAQYRATGHDPYTDNAFTGGGAYANYPPLLLDAIYGLGSLMGGYEPLGWVLTACTLLLFAALATRLPFWAGGLLAIAACTGGPGLALERGNTDQVVLLMVALSAIVPFWLERKGLHKTGNAIFIGLTLLGVLLKLIPVFASLAALNFQTRRSRWVAIGCSLMAALAYCFMDWHHVCLALTNTRTAEGIYSYGLPSILKGLEPAGLRYATAPFLLILMGSIAAWLFRRIEPSTPQNRYGYYYTLALAGASIHTASYLLVGNFSYRLIFLLLCVPYLALQRSTTGTFALILLVVYTAFPMLVHYLPFLAERHALLLSQTLGLVVAGLSSGWLARQAYDRLLAGTEHPSHTVTQA